MESVNLVDTAQSVIHIGSVSVNIKRDRECSGCSAVICRVVAASRNGIAAIKKVIALPACQRIVAAFAVQRVVIGAAIDRIAAVASVDDVGLTVTRDDIGKVAAYNVLDAVQRVVAIRAGCSTITRIRSQVHRLRTG